MLDADTVIESVLQHALPYDPVKAHEYYLKTRELKGRRSVTQLRGKSKKEGWAYTKNQIDTAHKLEVKNAALRNKANSDRLVLSGQKHRALIAARFKKLLIQTTNATKAKQDLIRREVNAKIAAVPTVPKGLGKEQTALLLAKRNEEIAKLRGEATAKLKGVSEESRSNKKKLASSIEIERKKILLNIKTELDMSRAKYKRERDALKSKYQAELDAQFNNIKGSVQ